MTPETRSGRWRGRLLAWSLVPMFMALIGVAVYTYLAYRQAAAELVIERDQQLAFLSAARLQAELSKFSQALEKVARSPGVNSTDPGTRHQALAQASLRLGDFDGGVFLLDYFGTVTASEPDRPDVHGENWSDQSFFQQLLTSTSPVFANTITPDSQAIPVALIGVPVLDEAGGFAGALVGMFRLGQQTVSSFYASIVRLRIGQTGTTYVVDGRGNVIFDSTSRLFGVSFSEQVMPGVPLDGRSGSLRARDAQGRDVVASYARIPGTPWTLVTEDDWDTLTLSTRRYANLLLSLLAVGMILPAVGVGAIVRQNSREALERERLGQDARVARHMQLSMLPQHVPVLPGWELAAHHVPGGGAKDFYDFQLLPDGRLMMCVGSIHEAPARVGVLMVTTRAGLRAAVLHNHTPCSALQQANLLLCPEMPPTASVDCLCAILDAGSGQVTWSHAGQAQGLHCHSGKVEELSQPSLGLGSVTMAEYDDHVLSLGPGDGFVICSAGLLNAPDSRGNPLGKERLCALLTTPQDAASTASAVLAGIGDVGAKTPQARDDRTLIVLMRSPDQSSGTADGRSGSHRGLPYDGL